MPHPQMLQVTYTPLEGVGARVFLYELVFQALLTIGPSDQHIILIEIPAVILMCCSLSPLRNHIEVYVDQTIK